MRKKWSFKIAYNLVGAAFTLGLLLSIVAVVEVILGTDSSISWDKVKLEASAGEPRPITAIMEVTGKSKPYEEYLINKKGDTIGHNTGFRNILDTLRVFKEPDFGEYLESPTVSLPFSYFKKSGNVHYFILQGRALVLMLLWEFILYQIFLILFDLGFNIFFVQSNTRRMRRMGYAFLCMGLLNFNIGYNVFLTPKNELIIREENSIEILTGNFWLYLAIASIVFVFAWIFNEGDRLKHENDLTV